MTIARPPAQERPVSYNCAVDLLERNLVARPGKVAVVDDAGSWTYAALAEIGRASGTALQ